MSMSLFVTSVTIAQGSSAPKPFLQEIVIQTPANKPSPTPTPGVQKTASTSPVGMDTLTPGYSEITIPGYSGILVESLDGKVVKNNYSDYAFNPASNVKIATSYAVIKTFGPDYRFATSVFTDGTIDQTTGTLIGNVYVSGRDPNFNYEHGVALANALNKMGIRNVNGDLIVTSTFVMALSGSYQRSGEILFATMDGTKRSAAASRAWSDFLTSSGKASQYFPYPSVSFTGGLYVDIIPTNSRLLFTHESAPLKEIVKVTMCYSNNFLSERLGDMIGGPYAVSRVVQLNAGVPANEFYLQTSSGLGNNRVTPRAMMKLLRTFRNELAHYKMTFMDVMPVAGVDPGTLENRFKYSAGSVVGKTGTLGQTDGGVSALSGEMQTKNGRFLFVIFNQRGTATRFRSFQDSYVGLVQSQNGGPATLGYPYQNVGVRLAKTRITYPNKSGSGN